MRDFVVTDSVANGFGKSESVIFRIRPGFTTVEETKAPRPVKTSFDRPAHDPNTKAVSPAKTKERATPGR